MEVPDPTKALLASFHSGRKVFIQMPASGIKLLSLASNTASIFSVKLTSRTSPFVLSLNFASVPYLGTNEWNF